MLYLVPSLKKKHSEQKSSLGTRFFFFSFGWKNALQISANSQFHGIYQQRLASHRSTCTTSYDVTAANEPLQCSNPEFDTHFALKSQSVGLNILILS